MKEKELLGQNVKRHRQFRGLDQKDLAKAVGLSSGVISRLERGVENIGIDNLIKISKRLNIGIEELFMANPEEVNIKFAFSEGNIEALRKLLGRAEYILQIKKQE